MASRPNSPSDFTVNIVHYLQDDLTKADTTDNTSVVEKGEKLDGDLHIPAKFDQLEELARSLHAKCLQLQNNCLVLNASLQKSSDDHDASKRRSEERIGELEHAIAAKESAISAYEDTITRERDEHLDETTQLHQRLVDAETESERLQDERELFQAALQEQKDRMMTAVRQLETSMSQNKDLEERLQRKATELENLSKIAQDGGVAQIQSEKVQSEQESAQSERLQSALAETRQQLDQSERMRKSTLAKLKQTKEASSSTATELSELSRQHAQLTVRTRKLKQQLETVSAERAELVLAAKEDKQRFLVVSAELQKCRRDYEDVSRVLLHEIGRRECGPPSKGERQQYRYKYAMSSSTSGAR